MNLVKTHFLCLTKVWLGCTATLAIAIIAISIGEDQAPTLRGLTALGLLIYVIVTPCFLVLVAIGSRVPSRRTVYREAQPICRGCGYDLRATPDRCPECGKPTAK